MNNNSKMLRILFGIIFTLTAAAAAYICIPWGISNLDNLRTTVRELLVSPSDCCYMYVGDSLTASVTVVPDTAPASVSWSDTGDGVVAIDQNGVITARNIGESSFTASVPSGVQTTVSVKTIEKPLPPDSEKDYPTNYKDLPIIANVWNPLPSNYKIDLVTIPKKYPANRTGMQVTPDTLEAYERMYADALEATGQRIYVLSAYRSYQKQQSLFDEDVASFRAQGYSLEAARIEAGRTTQLPGCSEHQLGYTMDIGGDYSITNDFANSKLGKWVTAHAHEYGFILRYPADKVAETGIDYEAWHFRYVGTEHSYFIYEHGLCLEEYVKLQKEAQKAAEEYAAEVPAAQYIALMKHMGREIGQ